MKKLVGSIIRTEITLTEFEEVNKAALKGSGERQHHPQGEEGESGTSPTKEVNMQHHQQGSSTRQKEGCVSPFFWAGAVVPVLFVGGAAVSTLPLGGVAGSLLLVGGAAIPSLLLGGAAYSPSVFGVGCCSPHLL